MVSKPFLEKVRGFDKSGSFRAEMNSAMQLLKDFRVKYPFAENPDSIEDLSPDDLFREQSGEVGDFFIGWSAI